MYLKRLNVFEYIENVVEFVLILLIKVLFDVVLCWIIVEMLWIEYDYLFTLVWYYSYTLCRPRRIIPMHFGTRRRRCCGECGRGSNICCCWRPYVPFSVLFNLLLYAASTFSSFFAYSLSLSPSTVLARLFIFVTFTLSFRFHFHFPFLFRRRRKEERRKEEKGGHKMIKHWSQPHTYY